MMMNKRMLSLLLAVILVIGLMPTSVFATENAAPTETSAPAESVPETTGEAVAPIGDDGEGEPEPSTEAPTDPAPVWCEICQMNDCGKEHRQCPLCGAWDCDGNDVFCDTCKVYNCGKTHGIPCLRCGVTDCGIDHDAKPTEPTEPEVTEPETTEPPVMAPEPEEETLFDKMMAAESIEDMYVIVLDYMNNDPQTLMALTAEEIADLKDRINELDPEGKETDTADLLDTLSVLPNGGEELEGDPETLEWVDDHTFSSNETINKAITIKDNDGDGREANWKISNNVTLTINKTVTIPADETLDIYIPGDSGSATIKAGDDLGTNPMFIVNGTLKISYENNNKVTINGGKIQVNDSGKFRVGAINVKGNVTFSLANNSNMYIAGNATASQYSGCVTVSGNLNITGAGSNKSKVIANERNENVTADNKLLFRVSNGGSISFNAVTVDGGAKWTSDYDARIQRNSTNTGLSCGFVRVDNQKTKDDGYEFSATNCVFKNAARSNSLLLFYWKADAYFNGVTIQDCADEDGSGLIRAGTPTDDEKDTTATKRTFVMENSTITRCGSYEATGAGGVIRTNGTVHVDMTLDNITLTYNYSRGWGNILWNAVGSCNITNSTFSNNTSGRRGGAISSEGEGMTIENCTFTGNTAGEYGGAICMFPYTLTGKDAGATELKMNVEFGSGCTFENNTSEYGGAVAILIQATKSELPTNLTASIALGNSGYMKNNEATIAGGAVYAGCTEADAHEGTKINLAVNSGTISNNEAPIGGAIFVNDVRTGNTGVNTVTVAGGAIYENDATNSGGAIAVDAGNFVMTGGTVRNNSAVQNGGAVYVTGGNVTVSDGTISENSATNGGAAYVQGGNLEMSGGTIQKNTATVNGGALYVDDGNFTMTSGTMTENKATGTTSNGGGAYVEGGNVVIGIKDCDPDTDDKNHTVVPTDKPHPVIQKNSAVDSGGGIALIGNGNITMYCGDIVENNATNRGRGLNIYMEKDKSNDKVGEFHFYDGDVGALESPELVIVGGKLVNHELGTGDITLTYFHCNDANDNHDGNLAAKTATASIDSKFNLPDGEKYWTAPDGYRFFGWTFFGPNAENAPEYVRNKEMYEPLGEPIQAVDSADGIADNNISMYALWAPNQSNITYAGYVIEAGEAITFDDDDSKWTNPDSNPATYDFTVAVRNQVFAAPTKPGYTFTGWYIYQDEGQNANWGLEPLYKSGTKSYENLDYAALETAKQFLKATANGSVTLDMGSTYFGDITLIAKFKPAYTDLRIRKEGWQSIDENQTFLFKVTGTPKNTSLGKIEMTVTVHGNGDTLIKQLPVGDYKVEEITTWSWRYTSDGTKTITLDDPTKVGEDAEMVIFDNTRKDPSYWLSGDCFAENQWDS